MDNRPIEMTEKKCGNCGASGSEYTSCDCNKQSDLDKIKGQLENIDKMKVQLQAQGNALSGAIQQCNVFLSLLGESSPDSSIPSQDDSAAVNTALSWGLKLTKEKENGR